MVRYSTPDAVARNRALRRLRKAGWGLAAAAAGFTAVLSITAADAFSGHGRTTSAAPVPRRRVPVPAAVVVPPPQHVPALAGAPPPLQPPAAPPVAAPAAPAPSAPAPQVSGGS